LGAVFPWVVRVHDYPHALVRLHFCRVYRWSGELHAREHQRFGFFGLGALPTPLLPASVPILRGLELPPFYAISDAVRLGRDEFLRRLALALERGLRLLQLREPRLADDELAALFEAVGALTRRHGASLIVSSRHPASLWQRADGVHMTAQDLMAHRERPPVSWVGASVHDASELEHAMALGVDFAVLGPVQATQTHVERAPLGWSAFKRMADRTSVPLYALGGLRPVDLEVSLAHGAHGVALLSAAWSAGQCFGEGASAGGVSSASSAAEPGTA
jgi:8-oxo-dGTP diphosphatase